MVKMKTYNQTTQSFRRYRMMFWLAMVGILVSGAVGADSGSKFKISPSFYRFGKVDEGTPARLDVILHNGEDFTVHITNVRTN